MEKQRHYAKTSITGEVHWMLEDSLTRDSDCDGDDVPCVTKNHTYEWYKNGKLHRNGGRAARIFSDGRKEYYENGVLLKNVSASGEWEFYEKCKKNPAKTFLRKRTGADGKRETFDEKFRWHSYDDEPALVEADGDQLWFMHGVLHRPFSPAIIRANGTCEWLTNGQHHRAHLAPAIIRADGHTEIWFWGKRQCVVTKDNQVEEMDLPDNAFQRDRDEIKEFIDQKEFIERVK